MLIDKMRPQDQFAIERYMGRPVPLVLRKTAVARKTGGGPAVGHVCHNLTDAHRGSIVSIGAKSQYISSAIPALLGWLADKYRGRQFVALVIEDQSALQVAMREAGWHCFGTVAALKDYLDGLLFVSHRHPGDTNRALVALFGAGTPLKEPSHVD